MERKQPRSLSIVLLSTDLLYMEVPMTKTSMGLIFGLFLAGQSVAAPPPADKQKPANETPAVKVQPKQEQQQPKTKHPYFQSRRREFA